MDFAVGRTWIWSGLADWSGACYMVASVEPVTCNHNSVAKA